MNIDDRHSAGSVASPNVGQAKVGQGIRLGSSAEKSSDEVTLSFYVVCRRARHSTLADHRHDLSQRSAALRAGGGIAPHDPLWVRSKRDVSQAMPC